MPRQQKLNRSISFFVGHTQNRCHRTLHTLLQTAIFGIKQELDQHRAPILRRQSLVQEYNEPVPSLSSPTQTITLDDANSITLRSQRLANFLSKSFSMALMVLQPVLICPQSEIIAPHSDIRNTGSMGWRRPCCLLPAGLAGAYQAASTDITIRFLSNLAAGSLASEPWSIASHFSRQDRNIGVLLPYNPWTCVNLALETDFESYRLRISPASNPTPGTPHFNLPRIYADFDHWPIIATSPISDERAPWDPSNEFSTLNFQVEVPQQAMPGTRMSQGTARITTTPFECTFSGRGTACAACFVANILLSMTPLILNRKPGTAQMSKCSFHFARYHKCVYLDRSAMSWVLDKDFYQQDIVA
ncbi:hypothetical protein J7T55_011478 [Diaporthe amygdali]|uniref:uncharacterized protein n=1 Tax=Phomopsis amygdali TaxID=1214568 RepID=UPI0022FE3F04|nr:uncharacterized protein J7T55_011478 [Diaporthe amygdali]KAJ0123016.1 hypothetical protein J7T55_011478 [Diaporthe amygdali]